MPYGTCSKCGCTDCDCSQCIEKTGTPCHWVDDTHELCSACVGNGDEFKSAVNFLLVANGEELEFIKSFIHKLENFRDLIKRSNPSFSSYNETVTMIRNTDLCIDANIESYPLLQEFRDYVLLQMKSLGIKTYSEYIYKERNHFKS